VEPEGRLVGVVSKLDLLRPFVMGRLRPSSVEEASARAADIMQRKVVSVEAQESIIDAGRLMLVTSLRSLPVILRRNRRARPELVGMVSRGDLLRGLGFPVKGGARRPPTRARAYGKSHR